MMRKQKEQKVYLICRAFRPNLITGKCDNIFVYSCAPDVIGTHWGTEPKDFVLFDTERDAIKLKGKYGFNDGFVVGMKIKLNSSWGKH